MNNQDDKELDIKASMFHENLISQDTQMSKSQKQINQLKELAENYAHVYSFVGDDSMPIARDKLYKAIDEFEALIRTATLDKIRPEVERLLTDETVIANCINLETLNKAIDNLRGSDVRK